jgi:hypothetical protein
VFAGACTIVPAYWLAIRVLELPLRELVVSIQRPAACSVPLVLCLLLVLASTGGLAAGLQLALLGICGTAAYVGSVLILARGELRAITAAFRS